MSTRAELESTVDECLQRIRAAIERRSPVRILGGGSKDFYGGALQGEVLETRTLSGIVSYEPSELVVTVAAGTPLNVLEATLQQQGQCLAFEPPHFSWSGARQATVGGMVAAGLAGPSRASAGGVRDYVLGLKLINGRAEHLTFGGQVMKNVAGYDVSRLMVGALGSLGLITEVSLKVLPVAPAEATLLFELDQAHALEQLHRWGAQPLPLNASCWVHDASEPSRPGMNCLFVRLRGAHAAVQAAQRSMLAEVAGQVVLQAQAAADWELCRNQQLPFFTEAPGEGFGLWRLSLPQTAPVVDLPWPQMVEWHGALRWLWAPLDAGDAVRQAARKAGGLATLFVVNGASTTGLGGIFDLQSKAAREIAARVKSSFDPQGIFNPGRMDFAV